MYFFIIRRSVKVKKLDIRRFYTLSARRLSSSRRQTKPGFVKTIKLKIH